MPRSLRHSTRRPSGGERVFTDDAGRLWSAAYARSEGAVIFTCISDARQAVRAIAVEAGFRIADVADDTLRAWLHDAPRMGRLT